jgi:hypothetical protein
MFESYAQDTRPDITLYHIRPPPRLRGIRFHHPSTPSTRDFTYTIYAPFRSGRPSLASQQYPAVFVFTIPPAQSPAHRLPGSLRSPEPGHVSVCPFRAEQFQKGAPPLAELALPRNDRASAGRRAPCASALCVRPLPTYLPTYSPTHPLALGAVLLALLRVRGNRPCRLWPCWENSGHFLHTAQQGAYMVGLALRGRGCAGVGRAGLLVAGCVSEGRIW